MREKNKASKQRIFAATAIGLVALTVMAALGIYSCTKHDNAANGNPVTLASIPVLKTNGAQPLPQGKARFSVVLGRMDNTPWVRLGNWTFTASTGRVSATFWSWAYNDKHDVQILTSHYCTQGGVSKTVYNWTLYGWQEPGGLSANWAGNYTYNTTTGRLHIDWDSGAPGNSEDWDVSLPDAALARVKFVAGSSSYNVTHGRGYGSNAPWPDNSGTDHPAAFKTIDEIPSTLTVTSTTGRHVEVAKDKSGAYTYAPSPMSSSWASAAWGGHSNMGTPSSPTPKNTLHYWDQASTACSTSSNDCKTSRIGIVYHWSSRNQNRQMSWVNFCACLAGNGTGANNWPGYSGNMHPQAQLQILDDNSVMKGVIGVESQNPPSTGDQSGGYPGFQMQLQDFTTVSGS